MLGTIDDEMRIGLWLNLQREITRSALGVLAAIKDSLGGQLSPEWFKAIAETEEQAKAMADRQAAYEAMNQTSGHTNGEFG